MRSPQGVGRWWLEEFPVGKLRVNIASAALQGRIDDVFADRALLFASIIEEVQGMDLTPEEREAEFRKRWDAVPPIPPNNAGVR